MQINIEALIPIIVSNIIGIIIGFSVAYHKLSLKFESKHNSLLLNMEPRIQRLEDNMLLLVTFKEFLLKLGMASLEKQSIMEKKGEDDCESNK